MVKVTKVCDGTSWVESATTLNNSFPTQINNSVKFLTTDGMNVLYGVGEYENTPQIEALWQAASLVKETQIPGL